MEITGDSANLFSSPAAEPQEQPSATKARDGPRSKKASRNTRQDCRPTRKRIFSISKPKARYNQGTRFQRSSSDKESDAELNTCNQEGKRKMQGKLVASSPAPELSEEDRAALWKGCSRGAATRKRVGATDLAMPVDSPIHTILQLVPVSVFCATLYKSKQAINATVPKVPSCSLQDPVS